MKKSVKLSNLILASKSPRRRYLLEQAGLEFSVIPSGFDESSIAPSSLDSYVTRLAEAKAGDIAEKHPGSWIIGADTIVFIDNAILGKPESRAEARTMLRSLSAKTHQVYTGYCICCRSAGRHFTGVVKTDVCFKELTEKEIEWYINSGEPFDKAGAYAIQGLGTFLVRSINGSYTNVVGLPVCEVVELLIKEGVVELGNDPGMTIDE
jgi:septum formation protein